MVVFVNKTDSWYQSYQLENHAKMRAQRDKEDALKAADASGAREKDAVAQANSRVAEAQKRMGELGQALATRDNENAALKQSAAVDKAAITEQAAALKLMQQNVNDVAKRNESLIFENDKVRTVNFDLTGANTDYQKRMDESERERRWLNEQLNQYKVETANLKNVLAENKIPITSLLQRRTEKSNPDLKGIIRSVRSADGQTYATISLGSADKVEKGMEFSVINPISMTFLSKFIVDSVDTNSAFGRLEGPHVPDVKPDYAVLSKL
jgi:chromosome segregation ATPase